MMTSQHIGSCHAELSHTEFYRFSKDTLSQDLRFNLRCMCLTFDIGEKSIETIGRIIIRKPTTA